MESYSRHLHRNGETSVSSVHLENNYITSALSSEMAAHCLSNQAIVDRFGRQKCELDLRGLPEAVRHQPRPDYRQLDTNRATALPGSHGFGLLSTLPMEIILRMIDFLDLQSLARLRAVCKRTKALVDGSMPFRAILQHAPQLASVLVFSGFVCHFSASTCAGVLRSQACVWCSDFGPFIFLPYMERCCRSCLERNPSLWVLDKAAMINCFLLPKRLTGKLRVLRCPARDRCGQILPGQYVELVSVRQAKQLALTVFESIDAVTENFERMVALMRNGPSESVVHRFRFVRGALMLSDDHAGAKLRDQCAPRWHSLDMLHNLGGVRVPWVRDGEKVDPGLWCQACAEIHHQSSWMHEVGNQPAQAIMSVAWNAETSLWRAWTRDGLAKHVREYHAHML